MSALPCASSAASYTSFPTANVVEGKLDDIEQGPYGLLFVARPELVFRALPEMPRHLRDQRVMVRASLKVGASGEVEDVTLLESSVDMAEIERRAKLFFGRIVFRPVVVDGQKVPFETDHMLIVFESKRKP